MYRMVPVANRPLAFYCRSDTGAWYQLRLYRQAKRKLIDASEVAFAAVREGLVKPNSLERVRSLDLIPSDARE